MNTKNNYIADVIIVSYKNPDMTIDCVRSIVENNENKFNIIIVDNASPDGTVPVLKSALKDVTIIENEKNLGYAGAINIGAKFCSTDFIVISNNDVVYRKGVLDTLLQDLENDNSIAVIGPSQEYSNGKRQLSYGYFPGTISPCRRFFDKSLNLFGKNVSRIKKVDYVDGAAMIVRRDVFEELNGFDEDFFFYSEEADFCFRAKLNGYKIVSNQSVTVTHYRGGANNYGNLKSENIKQLVESKVKFAKKHSTEKTTKRYILTSKIYYFLYSKMIEILSFMTVGKLRRKLKDKSQVLKNFYSAWQQAAANYYEQD